ncbi:hypothetical protein PYJP_02730 [Pyrofollis japonicus]|uniref:DUF58 domain-containing protein n=1 Tax=Pyrofollis japonicus TaxID=3060460 RepID=UPI00295B2358|nr:DUF58 domain-containing protein [Pyrofollis japonicus]BEP16921.1 hypothetical protein PYJP_02730 [Pyrofollis japonicus]
MDTYCNLVRSSIRVARAFAESLYTGLSRSTEQGLGLEYIDFRDYVYGDDVRYVDWRLSARSLTPDGDIRLIVKVFQAERMIDTMMVVDTTSSMGFGEKPWILGFASTLLASLADSLEDKLTLVIMAEDVKVLSPNKPREAAYILDNIACSQGFRGKASLLDVLPSIRRKMHRPVVVLTDYAHNFNEVAGFLKAMRAARNHVLYISIADLFETKPPLSDAVARLVGLEDGGEAVGKLRDIYTSIRRHIAALNALVKTYTGNSIALIGKKSAMNQRHRLVSSYLAVRSGLRALTRY